MKVLVVYYSMYGHVYRLAQAVVEGVRSVDGVETELRGVPETLPEAVLEKMGALDSLARQGDVPIWESIRKAFGVAS